MPSFIDRVGQKIGLLTVVARAPGHSPRGYAVFYCDCECGVRGRIISSDCLKTTKSCGCLRNLSRRGEALTQARLKELIHYNPETGEFTWKVPKAKRVKTGTRAGGIGGGGYWVIVVDSKIYRAHRLAWLYVYGYFPKRLDHRDRNPSNNRITNLREATQSQNRANSKTYKNNRCGLKGVKKYRCRWLSSVQYNGKRIHLGSFTTAEAAHAAYCTAAKELHGEFFCDGKD